jgi:enoyl-[acyl-carrier protein] reductase I
MFRVSSIVAVLAALALASQTTAFAPALDVGRTSFRASTAVVNQPASRTSGSTTELKMAATIDLKGKVAFIAGVADSTGYGWAIAKALANAGCTIIIGTWPPVLKIFQMGLRKGSFDEDATLEDGSKMEIAKIYPLDAVFDTPDDVPDEIKNNKRYAGLDGYTISEVAKAVEADYGKIDIVVHSLANGPEVMKPLLETSRKGYLAASSASAYSAISLLQKFGPVMNEGGSFLSLTYIASEKVIPGYGGGMSSAKAQLESDTRVLAYEAGRKYGVRVNTISAGPLKSRAASAIGKGKKSFIEYIIDYSKANAPLAQDLYSDDVGNAALFLNSPLARTVAGVTLYVDNGLHAMGMALDSKSVEGIVADPSASDEE